MAKYYRLNLEEVVDTVTDIPQEQWEKKQVLPYIEEIVEVSDLEPLPEETLEIMEDKVVKTKYKHIHIPNLEEYKNICYSRVKAQGSDYILSHYSLAQQTSALAGFYTEEENAAIIAFAKSNFDKIRSLGLSIKNATTKEEVDTFRWEE